VGGIAGHFADSINPMGYQSRTGSGSGRGSTSFAAGMSAADDNNIINQFSHLFLRPFISNIVVLLLH